MRAVKEIQAIQDQGSVGKIVSAPARFKQFLRDVRTELHNVTWPRWLDVRATTVTVLITTFFFGFYLGTALDIPMAKFMQWVLQFGKRLVQ